jgi:hypothetical protein
MWYKLRRAKGKSVFLLTVNKRKGNEKKRPDASGRFKYFYVQVVNEPPQLL